MSDKSMIHIGARHPVRFLARNFRGYMKNLKRGKIWLGEFEMEREIWDTLDASLPENAMLEIILWVVDGDPVGTEKPEAEEKQPSIPKGPHAEFWNELFTRRFFLDKSLWEVLEVDVLDSESARQLLHNRFETTSLSLVSPEQWENFCADHDLNNLFNMSRTSAAKILEGVDAKAS